MSFAPRPEEQPKLCPHCGFALPSAMLGQCPSCGGDVKHPPRGPPILQGVRAVLGGGIKPPKA